MTRLSAVIVFAAMSLASGLEISRALPSATLRKVLLPRAAGDRAAVAEDLSALRRLRGADGGWETTLDALLAEMDAVAATSKRARFSDRLPLLSKLPSYKLRCAALKRVVDQTLVPAGGEAAGRRQALAVCVKTLNDEKWSVRQLEVTCVEQSKEVSMTEMLKRSPADLETPAYAVVESRGRWEVRSYEGTTLCQLEGDDAKGPMAFRSLAGYILSSQNAEAEKMSMTTPVMMRQGAEKREAMAFVIPQQYSSKPPTPTNAQIKVQALPPRLQAAIWFGGLASDDQVAAKRSALEGLVAADGDYAIAPGAECYVAAYNDPFTPPWKRRNEVLLDVVKRQATTSAP